MDGFLIPANSKKSQLILGFFTYIDLLIFGFGVLFTVIMLMIIHTNNLSVMICILLPLLISTFLVLPVPYYHNILQLITNIVMYIFNRKRYYWKGWCVIDESTEQ